MSAPAVTTPSSLDIPATSSRISATPWLVRLDPELEPVGDRAHGGQRPDGIGVAVGHERFGDPEGDEDQQSGGDDAHHQRRPSSVRPTGAPTGRADRRPGVGAQTGWLTCRPASTSAKAAAANAQVLSRAMTTTPRRID